MQIYLQKNATRRMGYTRIEHLAGGAASFAALCNMTPICRTRGGEQTARGKIIAEVGASEDLNRLWSSPQEVKENNKNANILAYVIFLL
jgi:hypothetical protein